MNEFADCPKCGQPVAVYNPRHGDGTVRHTYWHKNPAREWCRVELDIGDHDLRPTR